MANSPATVPDRLRRGDCLGFSLVEVLVALVVLAVGMLGIASLYVEGLGAARTSIYRTTAITLAGDMADRIRSNPAGGPAYAGAGPGSDEDCVNGGAPCPPNSLAADDWFRWLETLDRQMPVGSAATVDYAAGAAGTSPTWLITVQWPEPGQVAPASYTLMLQL